ncbi:MAG TPA: membrane protein insertase YidC, partial [Thermoanaerobaculia bacterium]
METRRLLLAFVLSLAVIAIWYTLFPPAKPKPPEPSAPKAVPAPGAAPAVPGATAPSSPSQPAVTQAPAPVPASAAAEERITLQSGRVHAVLTNRGAQLLSMTVPEKSDPKSGTLEMVRQRAGIAYPYSLTAKDTQPSPLNQALFQAERSPDGRSVTFRYSGPVGTAEKTFRLDDRGLLTVDVRVPGRSDWGVLLGPGVRNPTAEEMKSRYERRRGVYRKGDDVESFDPGGTYEPTEVPGGSPAWVGLDDTYYLAAQVPQGKIDRAVFVPMLVQTSDKGGAEQFLPVPSKDDITREQKGLPREFFLILRPAGDQMSLASYWGPKEYDLLHALRYGLEGTIDLGSLKPLVLPLLYALHWIYDRMVANYGWA